jgi:hypothetical protein
MTWKYTDASHTVAARVLDDGAMESRLVSALPEGTQVLPADPIDFRTPVMDDYKARREVYLSRIVGIAWAAEQGGDTVVPAAALSFREGLLTLPDNPLLATATSADELKGAIMYLYRQLVAGMPDAAKLAFAKVDK